MVRKTRSDKGKQREFYRKRPVKKKRRKNGKLVVYVPKRSKFDPIKLQIIKIEQMSKEGFNNFPRHLRSHIKPYIFSSNRYRIDAYPDDINNKEKMGNLIIDICGSEGVWDVRAWNHKKNKGHCSPCRICLVKVYDSENGFYSKVYPTKRLSRYWFWRK